MTIGGASDVKEQSRTDDSNYESLLESPLPLYFHCRLLSLSSASSASLSYQFSCLLACVHTSSDAAFGSPVYFQDVASPMYHVLVDLHDLIMAALV